MKDIESKSDDLLSVFQAAIDGHGVLCNIEIDFKQAQIKAAHDVVVWHNSTLLSQGLNFGAVHSRMSTKIANEIIQLSKGRRCQKAKKKYIPMGFW